MLWLPSGPLPKRAQRPIAKVLDIGWQLTVSATQCQVDFTTEHQVMSSAVLNGGSQRALHFANLHVGPKCWIDPTDTTALFRQRLNPSIELAKTVGMLTAASMESVRLCTHVITDAANTTETISALVSTGIANAKRAGDACEYDYLYDTDYRAETINILVGTSARLSQNALVEAIMIVTEAKAACLQDLGILSKSSNKTATGTGTDSIAVACSITPELADKGPIINYVGKHTLFGERLATTVMQALNSSLEHTEI